MSDSRPPPTKVDLEWEADLCFRGRAGDHALTLDGNGQGGPSPVQALALSLSGCMAADVALILTRGRLPLRSLKVQFSGERAPSDPRRFVSVDLRFLVGGAIPAEKLERALALSRETYCSVLHSLREDIRLTVSYEIVP